MVCKMANLFFVFTLLGCLGGIGVNGECLDKDSRCAGWAAAMITKKDGKINNGCHDNAAYMLPNCPSSCHQCRCGDNDKRCGGWAKSGECSANPSYMSVHCRLSCKMCVAGTQIVEKVIEKPVVITKEIIKEVPHVPESTTAAYAE